MGTRGIALGLGMVAGGGGTDADVVDMVFSFSCFFVFLYGTREQLARQKQLTGYLSVSFSSDAYLHLEVMACSRIAKEDFHWSVGFCFIVLLILLLQIQMNVT